MKLEPVYLVAPEATSKSMSTRRVFLIASATFAAGVLAGEVHGRGGGGVVEGGQTGDPDLDELRRLAVKAPIEELVAAHAMFLDAFALTYRDDPVLASGVERLCDAASAQASPETKGLSRWLLQVIDQSTGALEAKLQPYRERLERVR